MHNPLIRLSYISFQGEEWAGDCIYFNASNSQGWYLNLGMAQRAHNIINLFFIVHVPDLGTFVNRELGQSSNVEVHRMHMHRTMQGIHFRVYPLAIVM